MIRVLKTILLKLIKKRNLQTIIKKIFERSSAFKYTLIEFAKSAPFLKRNF